MKRREPLRVPVLFHDWRTALDWALLAFARTGVKRVVLFERSAAWPFGVWRVREQEAAHV